MSRVELDWNGDSLYQQVLRAADEGAQDGADMWLELSNQKVPHDEGTLQGTGHVRDRNTRSNDIVGKDVVYDTPYAPRLYFHPEYNFQKGRMGKWIERAGEEHEDAIIAAVERPIQAVLRSDD